MSFEHLSKVFKNRTVLVTGHTGFKGSWLCLLLNKMGAKVCGYAKAPPTQPNLYEAINLGRYVKSYIGDILDFENVKKVIKETRPEIIIHLAAQSLVRESYQQPRETFATNILGTVNFLEAIRQSEGIRVVLNITTDKCYENRESKNHAYIEEDPLGGFDPYSSSKACAELVTSAYRNSFFNPREHDVHGLAIATARAGNIIGGGDWAKDRLVPDFIRAMANNESFIIRNPTATRPWQYVLDPIIGYLTLVSKLLTEGSSYAEAWNFGPSAENNKNVGWITNTLKNLWHNDHSHALQPDHMFHEAQFLALDSTKAKERLEWRAKYDLRHALNQTIDWYKAHCKGMDMKRISHKQIEDYFDYDRSKLLTY